MTVHRLYQSSLDKRLSARIKRHAIIETISHYVAIPDPLTFNDYRDRAEHQQQESDDDLIAKLFQLCQLLPRPNFIQIYLLITANMMKKLMMMLFSHHVY